MLLVLLTIIIAVCYSSHLKKKGKVDQNRNIVQISNNEIREENNLVNPRENNQEDTSTYNSNYFMITLESLRVDSASQDRGDIEPLDIPDWGESDNTMVYQNATAIMQSTEISKYLPSWNESSI